MFNVSEKSVAFATRVLASGHEQVIAAVASATDEKTVVAEQVDLARLTRS
ncbi:MAG TPA: hypothetical protein VNH11_33140 [Pirellulales bacterium]|nr:hypothetical protein [Pirellulales bacterium]